AVSIHLLHLPAHRSRPAASQSENIHTAAKPRLPRLLFPFRYSPPPPALLSFPPPPKQPLNTTVPGIATVAVTLCCSQLILYAQRSGLDSGTEDYIDYPN
ncbi:hypothetical protein TMatcc_004050, partial [Talaromyces marneffei ATCC 18224]